MAQRNINVVAAACAVVKVGGSERYLYKGSVVPSGVDQKDVKRLTEIGLLKRVAVTVDESADSFGAGQENGPNDDSGAAEKSATEKSTAKK